MPKNKEYYKGKFAIGIYKKIVKADDADLCVGLYDNAQQFARALGKTIQQAYALLYKKFTYENKDIDINGQKCEVAFVDMVEEFDF